MPARFNPARAFSARALVLERLARDVTLFPELPLEDLDESALAPRDAALAHAIHDAVVRHWRALARVLGLHLKRPWSQIDPPVSAALLVGLAQLAFLDRIPVHAAIDESVEWTKRRAGKAPAGLVNAVLRRCADLIEEKSSSPWERARNALPRGDGGCVRFRKDVLPSDDLEALAIATSHPAGLLRRWRSAFGSDQSVELVALRSLRPPPVILNTAHAAAPLPEPPVALPGTGAAAPAEPGLALTPHARAGSHVAVGVRGALVGFLQSRDDVWVQDPSSSAAVASIADLRPRTILDLCAGQGTKTRQLAGTFPDARILATDIDARRAEVLRGVFAGHDRVRVMDYDQALATHQPADLVLLDVPCTNTGVFARRPEARHRAGAAQLARLGAIQRQLLETAASRLNPGGSILYATCSLEPEENDQAVAQAADAYRLTADRARRDLPEGPLGASLHAAVEYSDGAFSALLSRPR